MQTKKNKQCYVRVIKLLFVPLNIFSVLFCTSDPTAQQLCSNHWAVGLMGTTHRECLRLFKVTSQNDQNHSWKKEVLRASLLFVLFLVKLKFNAFSRIAPLTLAACWISSVMPLVICFCCRLWFRWVFFFGSCISFLWTIISFWNNCPIIQKDNFEYPFQKDILSSNILFELKSSNNIWTMTPKPRRVEKQASWMQSRIKEQKLNKKESTSYCLH